MTIDRIFIRKAAQSGMEDGGPGSGNWGHRGRPGMVGGSGKGGGAHYRGGRSDIMYVSSKGDWLNGLSGERQREVVNMLKSAGDGDLKKGQQRILSGQYPSEWRDLMKAMTEARQWDKYKGRWVENLNEPSKRALQQYLDYYDGDTIAEKIDAAYKINNPDGMRMFGALLNGAMNREGLGVVPEHKVPENKLTSLLVMESTDDYTTQSAKRYMLQSLGRAIGLKDGPASPTADDVNAWLSDFQKKGLESGGSSAQSARFLRELGKAARYRDRLFQGPNGLIVTGVDDLIKENLDMLNLDMSLGPVAEGNIISAESRLFTHATNEQIQKYLSNKYQILGGPGPLKMGDVSKSMPIGLKDKVIMNGVGNMPPAKFPDGKIPTHDEIVARIGGLDKTKGSCASLTWVYLGNTVGYDVLDFRGSASEETFATKSTTRMMMQMPGVEAYSIETSGDYAGWHKMQKKMQPNKEYILCCARHQAIVRRNPDNPNEFQFLELQDKPENNGWKPLPDSELGRRFGARERYTKSSYSWIAQHKPMTYLFDADSVRKSPALGEVLGYMNTQADFQRKGEGGSVK